MLTDECEGSIIVRIHKAQCEDEGLKPIFEAVNEKQLSRFVVRNGLLFKEIESDLLNFETNVITNNSTST
ncbi:hypothetical protein WN55_10563 [Dufourea novaeangliae]|uniref:Uncharacterized protein n=1 Tax=Dufourea novaeangliae TaxID=178035 RepID=A0A154P496_DUFNO|nr:hypothetical protein WN55_10563 [Dufourea novaeangliae]